MKKSNCRHCYKCIRHCPVKSIRFSGNQAHIIGEDCILCGRCFVVCPQNAKEIADETEKVKKVLIQSGVPVYASLAPSFVARFKGVGIGAMREALRKLGFADAEETALGATLVKKWYDRKLLEGDRDILISSCCHSVNLLIQKYFPKLLLYSADILSPMQAHAADIRRRAPGAKVVFIGPCIAKKDEAQRYDGIVDAVLTFEDIASWLSEENIELKQELDACENSRARIFPAAGGIIESMDKTAKDYEYIAVHGVKNCINTLREIESGALHRCFIEMSACAGSCIGGPVIEKRRWSSVADYLSVKKYAGAKDFTVSDLPDDSLMKGMGALRQAPAAPSEHEIKQILERMGKTKPEDEINCSCCGYGTCRDKAVAIFEGKADVSMCLPFITERAENFSDNIVKNSPNGLVVLNENLEVLQINQAAMKIMNIRNEGDVLGEQVVRILDPDVFTRVRDGGDAIHGERAYLAAYEKYVEQTVLYDKECRLLISILHDITEEEAQRHKKANVSQQTVQIADAVVDKQMRIVQEIASLLGETAAETKIALTKLKDSLNDE
jgi:iron only hydrogenase large subunit-like protein/uncharacterized Fe-S cluster-containing protein